MGDRLVKKGLATGIIVLFICSSFMPITGSLIIEKQATQESLPFAYSTGDDSDISLITVKVDGDTGSNDWYVDDVRVNFTKSDDIAEIKFQIDGGAVQTYTEPFYITTDSTNHHLRWWALDYKGNYSKQVPFYFKQDQTPPEIEITYEWSGDHSPYTFTFTATAEDATSGTERVEFYLNDKLYYTVYGPGPEYVWEFLYFPLPKAIFKAVAYDMTGNSATDYIIEPLNLEVLESPIFSTDIVEEKDSHQSSQSIIQKTEIIGIEKELYREIPKSDCSITGVFDVASLVVAVNRKILNGNWIDDDFKITLMPDPYDMKDVYYRLDDVNWMRYTTPFVISAEDGFHTFWWYFVDYKGYISPPESIVFNIDRTPPTINFTREKIAENKIKFTANVSDETSGVDRVDLYVDGHFEVNFSSPPYEWIYIGSERYTVKAVVYDKAGNSNSSSLSTWHSKSGQQIVSIPSSQNVMSVVSSTENIIEDTPGSSNINDVPYSSEQILSYDTIVYAFIMGGPMGTGFYSFGPGDNVSFSEWKGDPYFSGGTWTNDGRWFCMHSGGTLYEVDPETLYASIIGSGSNSLKGLSYDPVNEKLYGISTQALYEIDMDTGEQEFIGFFNATISMNAIAFDEDGVLYGWASDTDYLYTIDTETGEAAAVGPLGININYAYDGSFYFEDDILVFTAFTLSPSYGYWLFYCDEDTGECSLGGAPDGYYFVYAVSYEIDTTPPITNISFNPPEPDGYNGWYVSNITVTLNASDDISGVNVTYYRINEGEWEIYIEPFKLEKNGFYKIEFYSVDNAGNIESLKQSLLRIDQTPPEINFTYEWSGKKPPYTFTFTVNTTDATSGVIGVDFYLNWELIDHIFGPGPYIYYIWIIKWVPLPHSVFRVIAWNMAGLNAYADIVDPKLSKNRIINTPFLGFLHYFIKSHLNLFPILQIIIQRVGLK